MKSKFKNKDNKYLKNKSYEMSLIIEKTPIKDEDDAVEQNTQY